LQRFSEHSLFPALIDELERRHPRPSVIGDMAVIDALSAIQKKNASDSPARQTKK
jgi:hypothetical protein